MSPKWTKDEVLEEAKRVRDFLRDRFVKHGEVHAESWLYATRNPETGEIGKSLIIMPNLGEFGPQKRDVFSAMIHKVGEMVAAQGVIFASEIWALDPSYLRTLDPDKAHAEVKKWTGRLEQHPNRVEQVFMNLEHHEIAGTMAWLATITRDAAGKPTLGEWDEQLWQHGTGRFINMLPPPPN